jgi:hypothetical protein
VAGKILVVNGFGMLASTFWHLNQKPVDEYPYAPNTQHSCHVPAHGRRHRNGGCFRAVTVDTWKIEEAAVNDVAVHSQNLLIGQFLFRLAEQERHQWGIHETRQANPTVLLEGRDFFGYGGTDAHWFLPLLDDLALRS